MGDGPRVFGVMRVPHSQTQRRRTAVEEIANSVSHGFGFLAALAGVPFLLTVAARRGDARSIVSSVIFSATLLLVYLSSTLFHAFPDGRRKRVFEVLDNAAVFLLIAGTYTPFTVALIRGPWGWFLFGAVWTLAAAGIVLTVAGGTRHHAASACLCLIMGWLALIALRPILESVPRNGVILLLCGGLAYTAGLAFWAATQFRYNHLVWHLFVLLGTACHYLAILWYAA